MSIITVVYNGETEIERTIKSVIEQTNKNFEYVIVDGSSTDNTLNVIEEYKENISVLLSEPDHGIYDAMNKAIDIASGEWLYFLNCGDYFVSNNVTDVVGKDLQSALNSLVVYQVNVTDRNGHIVDQFPYQTNFSSFRELFYYKMCHQAIFAKREDYLKVGRFDLNFKVYSDFYTIGKILKSGVKLRYRRQAITVYNNMGVSNDWRNVTALSKERELILSLLDDNFSGLRFLASIFKSYLYYLRKYIQKNG